MQTVNPVSEANASPAGLPGKGHYLVKNSYFRDGRIYSYAHQIDTVIEQTPSRVLEVGKGPGLVAAALRSVGVQVTTLDMQAELEPDLVGSVMQIPAPNDSFDVSLCCQVLEHLTFEQFIPALKELRRVTRNALVLSLPDQSPHFYVKLLLPKSIGFSWEFSRPRLRLPVLSALSQEGPGRFGHFWEIGCKGTTLRRVRSAIISSNWEIVRTWRVPEKTWHRFFLLKP
jgi:ubiquinone/menaquinone biosynthesis C-methylase UbiE